MQEEAKKAEELERAWKEAYSVREDLSKLTYIGKKQVGNREYFFFVDTEGKYWYETNYDRERREIEKEKNKRRLQLKYRIKGDKYGGNTKKS